MNSARASSNVDKIILDKNNIECVPYLQTISKELDNLLPPKRKTKNSIGAAVAARP